MSWYNSLISCGLEPKPIHIGATLHSLCVAIGKLALYKLHVRTYGGKSDEDLNKQSNHTRTIQKWINLLNEVLDDFKGKGHTVTMDSAYVGNILAQVGRYKWLINMIGTA